MKRRESKKSETLEVRVSYETKTALQNKARDEGLTLSALLRGVIDQSLEAIGQPVSSAKPLPTKAPFMTTLKTLSRRPRLIASATATLLASVLMANSVSAANEIDLDFNGMFIEGEGHYSFGSSCTLEIGESCSFEVSETAGVVINIRLDPPAADTDGKAIVEVDMIQKKQSENVRKVNRITTPISVSKYDVNNQYETLTKDGGFLSMSIRAEPAEED